jgi:hypothetical protein
MTVRSHPFTFRVVRADHVLVMRDGKRVGALCQTPAWAEKHANRWRYWEDGKEPSPYFRDLEEAQEALS